MPEPKFSYNAGGAQSEGFVLFKVNKCGQELLDQHPQIIEDSRDLTAKEIAKKYKVTELFDVTESLACSIVSRAKQLALSQEERQELYGERLRRALKFSGSWYGSKEIDGMSEAEYALQLAQLPEYRLKDPAHNSYLDYERIAGAVNAKFGGNRSGEAAKGFFDRVRIRDRKGVAISAEKTPAGWQESGDDWESGESIDEMTVGQYVRHLANDSKFQWPAGGRNAGRPNISKILEVINGKFAKKRTEKGLKSFLSRHKKRNS